MKNIHVIPTGKEPVKGDLLLRHLWKGTPIECISWWRYNDTTMYGDTLVYTTLNGSFMDVPSSFKVQNIYITSDEEIKEGDGVLAASANIVTKCLMAPLPLPWKKIILTTDQDLIKDGVQAIDNEFLEWFVKNPSCEFVEVKKGFADGTAWGYNFLDYKIIIPKEEPKQELPIINGSYGCTIQTKKEEPKQETLEQTAVEWLSQQVSEIIDTTPLSQKQEEKLINTINKALEMEDEQKHSEYMRGWYDGVDITK